MLRHVRPKRRQPPYLRHVAIACRHTGGRMLKDQLSGEGTPLSCLPTLASQRQACTTVYKACTTVYKACTTVYKAAWERLPIHPKIEMSQDLD